MRSFSKKIITLAKDGFAPVQEGVHNFHNPTQEIEELAKERSLTCEGCPLFKKEPVSFLQVEDERIGVLSNMYCEECGCTLPYKTRQSKTICSKWVR